MQTIPIGKITADTKMQARVEMNIEAVEEYAAAIKGGSKFPPLVVFDDGETNWLADGWHRLQAYKNLQYFAVECEVHKGSREDAILHAVHANDRHGLRRTHADKRRSVELLLGLNGWRDKSSRQIADQCGVGHQLVESVKKSIAEHGDAQLDDSSSSPKTVGKDGKRRGRPRKPRGNSATRAKDADKELLSALKKAWKVLAKMPFDGATVGDKFPREKMGPNFDGAVAFIGELCSRYELPAIDLVGATDIPPALNRGAWTAWLDYRKQAKLKKYTPVSAQKLMAMLAKHPAAKQQEIVDLSIRNGYQGLFDKRDSRGTNSEGSKPRLSAVERVYQATAHLVGDEGGMGVALDGGAVRPGVSERLR